MTFSPSPSEKVRWTCLIAKIIQGSPNFVLLYCPANDSRQFIAWNRKPSNFLERRAFMLTEVTGLPVVEADMGTIVVEEVFLDAYWKGLEHVKTWEAVWTFQSWGAMGKDHSA